MNLDWTKYERLRDEGWTEHQVYLAAVKDGHQPFPECIRMLKDVFGVDLMRAKEIHLQADGIANSLDEYQAGLAPMIERALQELDHDER